MKNKDRITLDGRQFYALTKDNVHWSFVTDISWRRYEAAWDKADQYHGNGAVYPNEDNYYQYLQLADGRRLATMPEWRLAIDTNATTISPKP